VQKKAAQPNFTDGSAERPLCVPGASDGFALRLFMFQRAWGAGRVRSVRLFVTEQSGKSHAASSGE